MRKSYENSNKGSSKEVNKASLKLNYVEDKEHKYDNLKTSEVAKTQVGSADRAFLV